MAADEEVGLIDTDNTEGGLTALCEGERAMLASASAERCERGEDARARAGREGAGEPGGDI